jgi:RNA polymerase sigma-70 factor (ECF subfamily)
MKDEQLVNIFKQGDREGFEILVVRYQRTLFYIVKSIVMSREDARDITQQAFIRAFRKIHRLREPEHFKAWLFKIGTNLARDHIRRKREYVELEECVSDDNRSNPALLAAAKDTAREIHLFVQSLPVRQREVVSLRLFAELSFAEIAELLGIKEQSARTNFHFGIKKIRNLIRGEESGNHGM